MKVYDVTVTGLPPELGETRIVPYHGPDDSTADAACTTVETMIRFDALQREIDLGPLEVSAAARAS